MPSMRVARKSSYQFKLKKLVVHSASNSRSELQAFPDIERNPRRPRLKECKVRRSSDTHERLAGIEQNLLTAKTYQAWKKHLLM